MKGEKQVADTKKAAEQQAQVDHNHGQSAPNMTNWSPNARDSYHAQREAIRKQEEDAKRSS
jgi:hypothetical protein